jgi:hypothetical protein
MERRSFIRSFVRELKVTRYAVVLNYTMPLLSEEASTEEIRVLFTVQHGRPSISIAQPKIKNFFELSIVPTD